MTPLVSIICLCYNQKAFVASAIRSALSQTYSNIELIVVDDGSTDGSKEEIRSTLSDRNVQLIDLKENIGNCAAFNRGYRASKGEYLIDLAADDLLLPTRVEIGVNDFINAPSKAGVQFTDAFIVDENAKPLRMHYQRDKRGQLLEEIPSGNVYQELIQRYFICPPTMMMRRSVLNQLDGYDESLRYEDFDFWIRSARDFEYLFNPAPLVKKRAVKNSHSANQFKMGSAHALSTFKICNKIYHLNQSKEEDNALIRRCKYEIKQCMKMLKPSLIPKYISLINKTRRRTF